MRVNKMTLNEYQEKAMKFAKYKTKDYPFSALSEEVGEVQGKLAKAQRKWGLSQDSVLNSLVFPSQMSATREIQLKADLKKELGDVLWQLQACCDALGFELEDVAVENLEKLSGREERGTIVGEGDER